MNRYAFPSFRRLCQALLPALLCSVLILQARAEPDFETIYGFFQSPAEPSSKLIQARDGSFYGTTERGGSGAGTVFKVTPSGKLAILVNFTGANGRAPRAGLVQGKDGNFYGTTSGGGGGGDYGTVFKMTPSGTLTTLVDFTGTDGGYPSGGLVQGRDGNFYGTTGGGGSVGYGTVFKMTASGKLTTLVNFTGDNGYFPQAGLVLGSDGDFYGTTSKGGSGGYGTVFKMTANGTLTTLVNFTETNGSFPRAGLVQGSDGDFYGTTSSGGSDEIGTVFKMTASGTLTTLVNFNIITSWNFRFSNGRSPLAELMQGSDGNFYETTYEGGRGGSGTVFMMTPTGTLTTLVNFNGANGRAPQAGLILAADGNLYGTTSYGGSTPDGQPAGGGVIYRLRFDPVSTSTAHTNFAATQLSTPQFAGALLSDPSADPDEDGLVNLLEYAFNLNPLTSGNPILVSNTGLSGLPLITSTGSGTSLRLRLEYLRRKSATNPGLTYTPQFSSTLTGTWSAATGPETVQSIDSDWERVTEEEPTNGGDKRFGRVMVISAE
jgi:uncharacterized repeat protein (TIGR03803 family)